MALLCCLLSVPSTWKIQAKLDAKERLLHLFSVDLFVLGVNTWFSRGLKYFIRKITQPVT